MKSVIITDGKWRKSLSAVRSLGKAGYRVTVTGDSWSTAAFYSSYCQQSFVIGNVGSQQATLLESIKLVKQSLPQNVVPILVPMEDSTIAQIMYSRSEFESDCVFLLSSRDKMDIARNKGATLELARRLNIPIPTTLFANNGGELKSLVAGVEKDRSTRWIVKPVVSSGSLGVVYLGEGSLDADAYWSRYGPALVQERVPQDGAAIGVSMLFGRSGNCVAQFAHRRVFQYPVSGGPSTVRTGCHVPDVVRMSRQLLEALEWVGVAMVEWKIHPVSGVPLLMEINPRFWGSLELAVRSGVDFPRLYAEEAAGERPAPVLDYQTGVICRWMVPGEVLRYAATPRGEREEFRRFLQGLPGEAEEWDVMDRRGFVAMIVCSLLELRHRETWQYLSRR